MALIPYYDSDAEGVADFAADVVHARGDGVPSGAILEMYAFNAMTRYLQQARFKQTEAAPGD